MFDRFDSNRRRIIGHVKNGKSTIYHCQQTNTYWRTLKSAKALNPESKRIKNPRCKKAKENDSHINTER